MIQNSKFKIQDSSIKTPLFVLAPMANITTYPFASQCTDFGADLVWTPMVHTDTIINNWNEAEKILNFKKITNYIIQLVGSEPGKFEEAIKIIKKNNLNPLGFDINTGCPDKNILKSGCGGSLLKNPNLILDIVKSAQKATTLPISVKTRAGYDNHNDIYELAPRLIDLGISILTIHPRTVRQGYAGSADWDIIKSIQSSLFENQPSAKLIGSGDIKTWQEAIRAKQKTSCDGVMIGRGALGRPWIFKEIKDEKDYGPSLREIKMLAIDLSIKANSIWGDKGIVESKKHYASYFRGFDGAKELRLKLMTAKNLEDVRNILAN